MLRKLTLGLVAASAVAMAALAPTSASAAHGWHNGGFHGGWHGGWRAGPRFFAPRAVIRGGGCMVRRLVATPFGYRYQWVNRCY